MIPPNFRLATGVSKFTGESKPDTWLEDYRVNLLTTVANLKLGGITAALMALLKHSGPETCTLLVGTSLS